MSVECLCDKSVSKVYFVMVEVSEHVDGALNFVEAEEMSRRSIVAWSCSFNLEVALL